MVTINIKFKNETKKLQKSRRTVKIENSKINEDKRGEKNVERTIRTGKRISEEGFWQSRNAKGSYQSS